MIHVTKGKGIPKNRVCKKQCCKASQNSGTGFLNSILYICCAVIILVLIAGIMAVSKEEVTQKNCCNYKKMDAADDLLNEMGKQSLNLVILENPLQEAHEKLVEENGPEFYHVLDASIKKIFICKI